jgi:choline transporter-like protein 2/4/5
MRCCIWCVDCCIKFITENAYIQTALKATSFCDSAQESFYMMIRNPGTYTATSTLGFLMSLLGKGFIVGLTGFLTFIITEYAMAQIEKPIIVAVIGAIIGYFVASLFL